MLAVTVLVDSGRVAEDTGHRQVQAVNMGWADCWLLLPAAVQLHNAAVLCSPAVQQNTPTTSHSTLSSMLKAKTGWLQLLEILEISWNLIGPPGNFCVRCRRSTALVSSHKNSLQ